MKTFTKSLLLIVILAVVAVGCAGRQPSDAPRVDAISDAMHVFNAAYEEAEKSVILLHERGILKGDEWNSVVDIRNQVAPIVIRLNEDWKLVPQTDASIEAFIAQPDFQSAVKLGLQLAKIAEVNDVQVKLNSLKREE